MRRGETVAAAGGKDHDGRSPAPFQQAATRPGPRGGPSFTHHRLTAGARPSGSPRLQSPPAVVPRTHTTTPGSPGGLFDALAARPAVTVAAMLCRGGAGRVGGGGGGRGFFAAKRARTAGTRSSPIWRPPAARSGTKTRSCSCCCATTAPGYRTTGDDARRRALEAPRRLECRRPRLAAAARRGAAGVAASSRTAIGITTLADRPRRLSERSAGRSSCRWCPVRRGSRSPKDEAAWVREQLADGRADGLVSANRRTAAVLAPLDPGRPHRGENPRRGGGGRKVFSERTRRRTGLTAAIGGMPALRLAIIDGLNADTELLFPLAGIFFLAAVALTFRRPVGLLVPGLGVGCGLAWRRGCWRRRAASSGSCRTSCRSY